MSDRNIIAPHSDAETPRTALHVSPGGFRLNSENPDSYSNSMLHINPHGRNFYWIIINEYNAAQSPEYMNILRENLAAGNPRFFTAETLPALANAIRIPVPALLYTMNRYNAMARAGVDTDLFKNPAFLVPMENGPWFAVRAYMVYFGTVGGLIIDEDAAVINTQGERISGLFAAGETANHGVFNLNYVGGVAFTHAAVFGRIAGANAAMHAQR